MTAAFADEFKDHIAKGDEYSRGFVTAMVEFIAFYEISGTPNLDLWCPLQMDPRTMPPCSPRSHRRRCTKSAARLMKTRGADRSLPTRLTVRRIARFCRKPVRAAPHRQVAQMRVCSRHAFQSETDSRQSSPDSVCRSNAALRRGCDWTPPFIELSSCDSRHTSSAPECQERAGVVHLAADVSTSPDLPLNRAPAFLRGRWR